MSFMFKGKRLVCLLLALLLCAPALAVRAEPETLWGYVYEVLDDESATIIKYRGVDEDVIIPAELFRKLHPII